nr:E-beta-farnesene synthase [Tanacetum cinerariifolium]
MADVNAPSGQAPEMTPPVRTDDQILPRIRWVPNRKSNCYMDLEKSQGNPVYKIVVDLLKNTNFFRAFTASSTIPSIYIQQFWDTVQYDKKAGNYRCQLDEQWFVLTKDTLREALQITHINNNQPFIAPSSSDALVNFVNELGYPKLVRNLSNDKRNLSRHTTGKKRATLIVIPSIRFTKLIIHHLQRRHKFHPRPASSLHFPNEEPVLGYLKFSAKGTKREVFGMPIPGSLITTEIQKASYYWEYLAKVAQHQSHLAGETRSVQDSPAPKPIMPARKPKSTAPKAPPRPAVSTPVTSAQPAPTSAPAKPQEKKRKQATKTSEKPPTAKKSKYSMVSKKRTLKYVATSEAEDVHVMEPQVAAEDAELQKVLEESMKIAYALPRGSLPPVVIREPESGKYQPLPEVPGKGKAKVTEEQSNSEEESKNAVLGATEGGKDEDQAGPDPGAQAEGQTGSDAGAQDEGSAGSNPDETSKGQVGPDPGNAEAKVQSIPSPVVHAGSDREHMDLDVADVSPQPSTEKLDEGFTLTAYPKVQENLKLAVEEQVLLEDTASSSGTLFSMQHLTMSSISLMTSPIIDLTSRPESPKVHQQFKATTIDTTTTTTTLPPPQAPQQSITEAMMIQRIGELEHIMANLIQVKKDMEERLDKHGARLYTLEQLDIPQQVSKAHARKRKKSCESLKTPPGSPPYHPPPPPPPARSSKASGAPGAFRSSQVPLPPPSPPASINQESPSKGSAPPSSSQTATSAEYQAWMTTDIRLRPTHMRILSIVRIEVFSLYGYDYMKKIVLRRADLNEHVIVERDFKYLYPSDFEDLYLLNLQGHLNHLPPKDKKILSTAINQWTRHLVIRQRVEDFQLGIESYQTQLNLTKPQWDATGFEYKHDYTAIDSPRAVMFRDKYEVQMMMRFNEIHKYSDGTLQQIDEALDYRVKEFRINRMNPDDAEGTACLSNAAIFEELARISAKTTAWNEFSSTMASKIICLANNQKFKFSKYIFKSMMKNLEVEEEAKVSQDKPPTEEHIPTPSHDPLPSGEDRLQLNELMEICTKLFDKVLSLEQINTNQAAKIEKLKKRVKKLEGKKKKRTHGLKRVYKVGLSARIISSDEEGLGD